MKKLTAVFLCLLILISGMTVFASANENDLKITVVNDLHLDLKDSQAEKVAKRNTISEEYAHASSGGQLPYESVAIIKSFLADAAKYHTASAISLPTATSPIGV